MTPATALVVDDEPSVRHLVRRILEPEVCGVVEVGDGEAALRLIQRRADSIDVVVTDLAMPGIDGFDVVEVLARHHPELPVLCMSGYGSELNADGHLAVPLIHKPFTPETLCDAVAQLIERSRLLQKGSKVRLQQAAEEVAASKQLLTQAEANYASAVDLVAEARALRAARARRGPSG